MRLIAHRGNMEGPNPELENSPDYIFKAMDHGFDVEIDVWGVKGEFQDELWLGHDGPTHRMKDYFGHFDYLGDSRIWYHCKNIEAVVICNEQGHGGTNFFFHDSDDMTLTSRGQFWTYPNKPLLSNNSICVMPELNNQEVPEYIFGVCSDFVMKYVKE